MLSKLKVGKRAEWAVLCLFIVSYIVVTVFHEPWFDEAQAWQIARCANLKDILFTIPHYEGHPPLWHLILAIPAKLGLPYEWSLKTVAFLICFAYTWLILFRSPFPRVMRLLLPFQYFLFYQYGVIARPYGLIILELLLLAMAFPMKNEKPWRFTGVLMLLCLTHSYGIMIAGGIALCMVWELVREKGLKRCFAELFRDGRTLSLLALLMLALLMLAEIMPREDTYIASASPNNSLFARLLCMIFGMLPECWFWSSDWFSVDAVTLQNMELPMLSLIPGTIVGIILWLALYCFSSREKFRYFYVPFLAFAGFGAVVYMTAHHIGVSVGILLFYIWIELTDREKIGYGWKRMKQRFPLESKDSKIVKYGLTFLAALCLLMPVYWSVSASVHDFQADYSYGRSLSAYLKETGLENARIFNVWYEDNDSENRRSFQMLADGDPTLLAYFDRNIIANAACGDSGQHYRTHKTVTDEEMEEAFTEWRETGIPEVLFGTVDVERVFGEEVTSFDYAPVFFYDVCYAYKDGIRKGTDALYVRNDLLEQYGLEPLDTSNYLMPKYRITDEMREKYESGEWTVEDILDATIGDFGKE